MRRRVHAVLFGSLLLFVCVYTIIIYIHQRTLHTYEIHKHMRMSPPPLGVELTHRTDCAASAGAALGLCANMFYAFDGAVVGCGSVAGARSDG